jgi:hypothetical protein
MLNYRGLESCTQRMVAIAGRREFQMENARFRRHHEIQDTKNMETLNLSRHQGI